MANTSPSAPGDRAWAIGIGTIVVVATFVAYVATASRDIAFGDTPELTAVAVTWGVAHPPGYPVFTTLGWVFSQLPLGTLPFRVALLSVVCHALTVGVVFAAAYRLTRSTSGASVAALALAFAPLFWSWSLVGEVFPLSDVLGATMLLLVAEWHERPARAWLLVGASFVGGLGMADQQTIALLAPATLYLMWRRRGELIARPRVLLGLVVGFAAGLAPYLQLLPAAARDPAWNWGDLRTPQDLLAHVLRTSFGSATLTPNTALTGGSSLDDVVALLGAFDPLQCVLLLLGAACAWRLRRWYATYILVAFLFSGPLFAAYSGVKISDDVGRALLQRFFLLPQTVAAPLAAFGVRAVGDATRGLHRTLGPRVVAGTALAAAFAFIPISFPLVNRSADHTARTFASDVLATAPRGAMLLVWDDLTYFPVEYLQTIEGVRPDVTVIMLPASGEAWYMHELRSSHPDLLLTADRFGPGGAPIKPFLDANYPLRPIVDTDGFPDESPNGAYHSYPRGLAFDVYAAGKTLTLGAIASRGEATMATYHVPAANDVAGPYRIWERIALRQYANAYYQVGHEYQLAGDALKTSDAPRSADAYGHAKDWFRRALAVDPTFGPAMSALGELGR